MALSLTLIVMVGLLLALAAPKSKPAYWLFRCAYASPVPRKSVLESYHSELLSHAGGYTPEMVDQFLCSRLEATASPREIEAIANFYALQASGREGDRIIAVSDGAKQKIIGSIMRNVDGYDVPQVNQALLLVEELRRGSIIWKGGFAPTNENDHKATNWTQWWLSKGARQVKALYSQWWQAPTPWRVKRMQNPLAGSGIEAIGP